jgi:putative transcriptional regulator
VLTATLDVLRAIAGGRGPARWLVALGYAGWSAGQLDAEMARHGWFGTQVPETLLFETPAEARWAGAWATAGIDPRLLSASAGHA